MCELGDRKRQQEKVLNRLLPCRDIMSTHTFLNAFGDRPRRSGGT